MDKETWNSLMTTIQDIAQEGSCPLCGNSLDGEDNHGETTCPNCGEMVDSSYSFCPNCGTKLDISEPGSL